MTLEIADVSFGLGIGISYRIVLLGGSVDDRVFVVGETGEMGTVFQRSDLGLVCAGTNVVDVHKVILACCDALMTGVVERSRGDRGSFGHVLSENFGWFQG